ncbi:hypothetical protein V6N11_044595 [Hibiscus sabdariffa]|uniref:Protein kinase domain-containing protein n=1 Tax=Hibiscus sabdariffa TaxID=183260 RepID=A0ABR2NC63_9ROSI
MSWLSCCRAEVHHCNVPCKKKLIVGKPIHNGKSLRHVNQIADDSKHKMVEEIRRIGKAKVLASIFTFRELSAATNNFNPNRLIGEGGFGRVYQGYIEAVDQVVAVKQLDRNGMQGSGEFFSEVLMLNLAPGQQPLDWNTRMKIAVGAAKGLDFGVVLLELISGRRVIDLNRPTEEQNLIAWAEPLLKDRQKFTLMVDPLLKGNYPVKGLCQALAVAAICLKKDAETRAMMADVVTAIEFLARPKDNEIIDAEFQVNSSVLAKSLKEESIELPD